MRLEIKEAVNDPNSDFNIKRFKFGSISVEGPIKTIDTKSVTKRTLEQEKDGFDSILLETCKTVRPSSIDGLEKETKDRNIKARFGFIDWFSDYPHITALTFKFSPYEVYAKIDAMSGFFDYYYHHSQTALFVPNIKIQKNVYEEIDGRLKRVEIQRRMSLDQFEIYVEEASSLLDFRNSKPIFVPLPLEFGMKGIKRFADQCGKKNYLNIWADFQASPANDTVKSAMMRHFIRLMDKSENLDNMVLHTTNVRREIRAHKDDDLNPASDILSPVIGSNIVGVNKDPPVPQIRKTKLGYKERMELWKHKARVFQPDSYYYVKVDKSGLNKEKVEELMNKKLNVLHNSKLLSGELKVQREKLLEEGSVKDYITGKPMIKEYRSGELAKTLFGGKEEVTDLF